MICLFNDGYFYDTAAATVTPCHSWRATIPFSMPCLRHVIAATHAVIGLISEASKSHAAIYA